MLQWGRGREAAESGSPAGPSPRCGRGFNGAAAVRPRRGPVICSSRLNLRPLQWGRGREAAERDESRPALRQVFAQLQWGRGREAAERRAGSATRRDACCRFNGAAAVRPRRAGLPSRAGHPPRCFNGAAAVRPRRGRVGCVPVVGGGGFNGAAAVRPRRGEPVAHRVFAPEALQWGRGREAAERCAPWRRSCVRGCRFNGAAAVRPRRGRPTDSESATAHSSFNGAAAVRPRRDLRPVRRRGTPLRASMGPRP